MRAGGLRLSSHTPWPAAAIAMLSALGALLLTTREEHGRALASVKARLSLAPAVIAAVAGLAVVVVALWKGSFIASGADIYGYVSQAHLWASGRLCVDQPLLRELDWPYAEWAVSPLGYRPATSGTCVVPVYAPGLPLMMALFERLAGRAAVFLVVPLSSGVAVWATYLMGSRLAGQAVGAGAALLLATSPTFLGQSLLAMSDVPATAWWSLSLALLTFDRRVATLAAGFAAGLAIIIRPNLVLLAFVLALFLVWRIARDWKLPGLAAQRFVLFGAGAAPACIALAIINDRLYGSPFLSGYGPLRDFYSWGHLIPNLNRYPFWMVQAHTPIVLLAFVAPFVARRWTQHGSLAAQRAVARCWLVFALAVLVSYLFYLPFDSPAFLRFLLPAFPPLFVLTSAALAGLLRPLGRVSPVLVMVLIGAVAMGRLNRAVEGQVFDVADHQQSYVAIGRYVADRLPERAVFISMQHSGSIRYYSGRLTLRYDWIIEQRLDWLMTELRRLGYHPYIMLDDWEVPRFRARFQEHSRLGALDWPPMALHRPSRSAIYDPADQPAAAAGQSIYTDVVW